MQYGRKGCETIRPLHSNVSHKPSLSLSITTNTTVLAGYKESVNDFKSLSTTKLTVTQYLVF